MKKNLKSLLFALSATLLITGCGEKSNSNSQGSDSSSSQEVQVDKANGAFTFVASNYEERTKILGALEKYAVENCLTGTTIYGNGGYVMYANGIVKGTENYIPGYGFGIVSEGEITADQGGASETNANWKRYYHTYQTDDPHTINYQNDKGSVVGDLVGYIAGSYWGTQMNATKDGYEWVGELSKSNRPIALNPDKDGLATKYRWEVKVGSEMKYATNSTTFASFNGREVALEDYITPYKVLYTKKYGMARGAESTKKGSSTFVGADAYYAGSTNGIDETLWSNVGLKAYKEGEKSYIEVEFNVPCNTFYAMYYATSGALTGPIPEDFYKAIGGGDFDAGVAAFGNFTEGGLTPVDTTLSTGAYVLETWNKDQEIVFKKNSFFDDNNGTRYKVAGIHERIYSAVKTDSEAAFNEFISNSTFSAVSIPFTKLSQYKSDPRTTTTVGSSTYKLNFNTCTPETWEYLFGEDGIVDQTAEEDYWECEPAMANKNFTSGLSLALNRKELAGKLGREATANYFSDAYLSDPENGVSYNSTKYHKEAMADLLEGTDVGYNLEKAKAAFKKASEELIASGKYKAGDKITLELALMEKSDEDDFGNDIKAYWEDAFNACGGGLTLEVVFWEGESWSDVYYVKMMKGQFDVGFGSISGNTLNPINFLEVLRSDNSSGFTLNWGTDTNKCDGKIVYNGLAWSYDALWQAADQGAYVENGELVSTYGAENLSFIVNQDGSVTISADITAINTEDKLVQTELVDVYFFGYTDTVKASDYAEVSVFSNVTIKDGKVSATIPAEVAATYTTMASGETYVVGFDFYFDSEICGSASSPIVSLYID